MPVSREDLTQSVRERLQREPTVRAIYVGWPDGSYLVLRRIGTGYAEYTGSADGVAVGTHLDAVFSPLGEIEPLVNYDPRVRPWYLAGANATGPSWTEPYLEYDTSNTLESVADAARVDGDIEAVVGADLNLDLLGGVLDDLPYGDGAEAFVLTPGGEVIAAPTAYEEQLLTIASATGEVPTGADIGLTHSNAPTRTDTTSFTRTGSVILLDRTFPGEEGLDWVIHITADEAQAVRGAGRPRHHVGVGDGYLAGDRGRCRRLRAASAPSAEAHA
ncbi:hypothetical protein GCM10025876_34240 [Demequina litorisediminis]|uniref:Uncharacterized protein n=1 Tax=Demequina litorisediminis TaxID=1849022 RepID=A0ABQ6IHE8_9MICO|nr:hypothetical protein GCM10025876_34240 [Demequina litorisediminis]